MLAYLSERLFRMLAPALVRIENKVDQIDRKVDAMGAKEDAALKSLDDLLDNGDKVLENLTAWQAAEDETDATAIAERVTRLQKQQEDLNALAGVSTTVNPSQPIDATTGQNFPPVTVEPEQP